MSDPSGPRIGGLLQRILSDGCAVIPQVVDSATFEALRVHTTGAAGERNVLDRPEVRRFATSREARALIEPILGTGAFAVRAILFDKTPQANWSLPLHRDTTIAVAGRASVPDYHGWTVKQGVTHVIPPASILEAMLTIRLHLDDATVDNGALLVVPGSHRGGDEESAVPCVLDAGGAVLMRPSILHGSRKATKPSRRRVLHVEYAACELPEPLDWHRRVAP